MNYMEKWKAGYTDPEQIIEYREAIKGEVDSLVFLSRVITVIDEDDFTEFIFLNTDLETFFSVRYHKNGLVELGTWINPDSPYKIMLRNEYGQLQALREADNER